MGEKLIGASVKDRSWLWRYSVAVASVAAALGLRFLLAPWTGSHLPYLTFVLAVAVTVWLAGFRPAMLAIAICIPAALFFVIPSLEPVEGSWFAQTGVVVMYSAVMVTIALLGRTLTQARLRAEKAATSAQEHYEELQREIDRRHKAVEEVVRAKLEWERTFDSVPDLIAILDHQHRIVRVNRAMAKWLGLEPDQCAGLTCYQAVHGTDSPPPDCPHQLTLTDGKEHTAETHEARLGGDFLVSTTPIRDSQGFVAGTVRVARDITERKRVEELLRHNEQRLQGTFDNAGMGIIEVDAQLHLIAANNRACEILGYGRDELLEMTIHDLTATDDRPLSDGLNAQLVQGQLPRLDYQKQYLRRDGRPVWVHVTVTAIRDSDGRLIRAVGTFEDISDLKEAVELLRQSEQRLQGTFDNAGMGILEIDGQHRIISANTRVCEILGYPREELIGMAVRELTAPEDRPHCDELVARIIQGPQNRMDFEKRYVRRDGKPVWAHVNVTAIRDSNGQFVRGVGTFEDISERIRTEESLRKIAGELARSNHDLEQFAYVASHDLQEPLRMVTGHLKVIEDRLKDKLDEKTRQSMFFAVDGATRMQELIRDLLTFSRAGRKGEGFLPTDMEKVLGMVTANLSAAISEAGATIEHDPLPTIQAEHVQMMQLFQNLIGNAVKYRAKDRKPQIRIGASHGQEGWTFSVRDNGIGIDPKHSQRVFEIFQRLHTRQEYTGTGIGLAVCKRIVEYHGGRIWLESAPGEGSTFFFTIPDRT